MFIEGVFPKNGEKREQGLKWRVLLIPRDLILEGVENTGPHPSLPRPVKRGQGVPDPPCNIIGPIRNTGTAGFPRRPMFVLALSVSASCSSCPSQTGGTAPGLTSGLKQEWFLCFAYLLSVLRSFQAH